MDNLELDVYTDEEINDIFILLNCDSEEKSNEHEVDRYEHVGNFK